MILGGLFCLPERDITFRLAFANQAEGMQMFVFSFRQRARRHPALRASASEQNQRSP